MKTPHAPVTPACCLLAALCLLAGCRREDWRETTFALPRGVPAARAAEALRALDSQTPPEVTVEGETLRIRYNSMRVAPGNFAYTLRTLANPGKEPTP